MSPFPLSVTLHFARNAGNQPLNWLPRRKDPIKVHREWEKKREKRKGHLRILFIRSLYCGHTVFFYEYDFEEESAYHGRDNSEKLAFSEPCFKLSQRDSYKYYWGGMTNLRGGGSPPP